MKSETSFRVFFLKQHRKNSLKNIFSHQKVYFWISAFDYWAIVLPKNAHCGGQTNNSVRKDDLTDDLDTNNIAADDKGRRKLSGKAQHESGEEPAE